jgi:hypothetical protein
MLKYLFTAHYNDGASIVQNQQDRSMQRDDKNAFFDVKYEPLYPLETLSSFELRGSGHTYTVDLRDGRFLVDGKEVSPPDTLGRRELIYFRRNAIAPQDPSQRIQSVWHLGWRIGEIENVMRIF